MKFVIILAAFLLHSLSAISQTSSKSKTTKTTKSTNKKLKSVTNNHSGPGIENTGTTDVDVKQNDSTGNKSAKTKAGTRTNITVTKSSGTKKKSQ